MKLQPVGWIRPYSHVSVSFCRPFLHWRVNLFVVSSCYFLWQVLFFVVLNRHTPPPSQRIISLNGFFVLIFVQLCSSGVYGLIFMLKIYVDVLTPRQASEFQHFCHDAWTAFDMWRWICAHTHPILLCVRGMFVFWRYTFSVWSLVFVYYTDFCVMYGQLFVLVNTSSTRFLHAYWVCCTKQNNFLSRFLVFLYEYGGVGMILFPFLTIWRPVFELPVTKGSIMLCSHVMRSARWCVLVWSSVASQCWLIIYHLGL